MIGASARRLDVLSRGDTAAHRIDPRAKLLATLAFLLTVTSFGKYDILPLLPLAALPATLLFIGKVPWRLLLRILLVASPFVLMMGLLNPFLDANTATVFGKEIPAGLVSMLSIAVRFILSISMVVALCGTTSMTGLIDALSRMKVPAPIVSQIHFLYRYIFVLGEEARAVSRARELRDSRGGLPSLRTASRMLSSLARRSFERSEHVFKSMKTRGFDGELPRICRLRMSFGDYLFFCVSTAFCVVIRFSV